MLCLREWRRVDGGKGARGISGLTSRTVEVVGADGGVGDGEGVSEVGCVEDVAIEPCFLPARIDRRLVSMFLLPEIRLEGAMKR